MASPKNPTHSLIANGWSSMDLEEIFIDSGVLHGKLGKFASTRNDPVMKKIWVAFLAAGMMMVTACNSQPKEKNVTEAKATEPDAAPKFTAAMVDNQKDPSCGMPVAAGIEDTIHYKGKVLGFCSKECRDDFLKDPEKNIAAADMKK